MTPPPSAEEELLDDTDKRALRVEVSVKSMIQMVLVLTGVWALVRLLPVVLVLITALFIVGTLSPMVEWFVRRGFSRGAAIGLVFSALVLGTLAVFTFTLPTLVAQVGDLIEQEPALRARVVEFLAQSRLTSALAEYLRNVRYDALFKDSAATVFAVSKSVLEVLAYGAGAVFLALYMMIDRDRLRGALFALVPRRNHIRLSRIMINLQTIVGGYIRGQVITCLMMACFLFLLLSLTGVPNALAISVFGGIADLLPFLGIFLTMGPAVAAAATVSTVALVIVFTVLLAYEEFESRVIIPVVYGRALRLPSSVVLFALITGATLMGIVGALLALPVAAAVLMLIDELQVELPGEPEQPELDEAKERDARHEREYERRTEGLPVEKAAAVAVRITERMRKEQEPPA
ncbi:AI-2E family transporter [Oxalobacteraceae bacterium OM1]|nr:AI-2E family transporter [Oxalobacteraceae bacterium OM1]